MKCAFKPNRMRGRRILRTERIKGLLTWEVFGDSQSARVELAGALLFAAAMVGPGAYAIDWCDAPRVFGDVSDTTTADIAETWAELWNTTVWADGGVLVARDVIAAAWAQHRAAWLEEHAQ